MSRLQDLELVSFSRAAVLLRERHGLKVGHKEVSFLVRVMGIPTHDMPSTARGKGIDPEGLRRLSRFLGCPRRSAS